MYPILFKYEKLTIFTYAVGVIIATLAGAIFTQVQTKKTLNRVLPNTFFYCMFFWGFIGGKLFLFFEMPSYYLQSFTAFISLFKNGFVFYGSFICCITWLFYYLKKNSYPIFPMLDIIGLTTLIVHSIGRMGCFLAGCCYGKETTTLLGVSFPHIPHRIVHPTQLYEAFLLSSLFIVLYTYKRRIKFNGQLFLLYIIGYASVRAILEFFRGDSRGFIIENYLSHSQTIALLLIGISLYYYSKLKKQYS